MSVQRPQDIIKSRQCQISDIDPAVMFIIAKSSNKNTVVYAFDPEAICRPYWLMFEKTRDSVTPTEALNFMENNLAYGVSTSKVGENVYKLNVVGHPKLNFEIRNRKCFVQIDEAYHNIIGVYVHQSTSYFSTGVDGVSIIYGELESPECQYLKNE